MTLTTVSQADLAKRTQEVVDRVQHGEMAIVESSGKEQAVLLDPTDFRLLRALAQCVIEDREPAQQSDPDVRALQAYLAEEIRLGKAAPIS
jgi:antitoxin (DNA-binding transcriptional repressor) of toxin-antitoxin stability system